ncbi:MAG: hypothetical protein HN929_07515 [Chloroflexi bacterium]|nr:hypothetical protein [Chloroflexota bacterium]
MTGTKMQRTCSTGVFFIGILLLIAHLLSISAGIVFHPAVFWVSIVLIIGSLIFQILKVSSDSSFSNFIIFEILVANFAFHMIYALPYSGLYGGSPTPDLWALNHFLENGSFDIATKPFPGFEIISGSFSLVTGIKTFDVVKFIPSILDTMLVLLLYHFLKLILKNTKHALLTILLFISLYYHLWFYSTFHWEVLGSLLLILTLYLYFIGRKSQQKQTFVVLAIMCLISLIFSHHLSSFIIVIFLIIFLATSYGMKLVFKDKTLNIPVTFVAIVLVIVFAYYSYVYIAAIRVMVEFGQGLFDLDAMGQETYGSQVLSPSITIRQYIEQYGFFAFHALFGAIIAYNLIFTRRKRDVWYAFPAIYLIFWGFIGILLMYVLSRASGNLDSERALIFGWIFGLAPLVAGIYGFKHKWVQRIGIGALTLFIFFGMYKISPIQWNPAAQQNNNTATSQDFVLAESVDFTGSVGLFSGQTTLMAIYNTHDFYNQYTRVPGFRPYLVPITTRSGFSYGHEQFPELEWVILNRKYVAKENEQVSAGILKYTDEEARELSENVIRLSEDGYDGYQRRNLVYSSNELIVFK